MTREQILAEALSWIGTPYRHGQMAKGLGADCLGFLAGVAHAIGYVDARSTVRNPKYRVYGRSPNSEMLDEVCEEYLARIDVAAAGLADVIRMTPQNSGRHAQHFGMVSRVGPDGTPTHMIHCTNAGPARGVTEHIIGEWRSRVRRAYAWRGVE